ncbi:MAG: TolC family protein [Armatimonadetes bacterium]|nr:TolC family protein [Armatimonadota bacterium]
MNTNRITALLLAGLLPLSSLVAAESGIAASEAVPTAAQAAPRAAAVLTLPEALAEALASSPRLEGAKAEIARARGGKRAAAAAGRPSLTASAGQNYGGPANELNPSRAGQIGADLSVPLDTNGRVKAGKRGAKAAEAAALASLRAESQRLVLDVTESYLDVLQAEQEATLLGELRRLNGERLRIARIRRSAEVGVPLEVTQAEADLAESVQGEIEAQARVRQASAALNALLGRPAAAPLALDPATVPAEMGDAHPSLPTLDRATPEQAQALGLARPDLQSLRAGVEGAEAGIDSARAARRPGFGLSGNLLQRIPETLVGGFGWSLGASLLQSLFDGGRIRAAVEQARAEHRRAGAALAEAERNADAQVETARVGLDAAEKRLFAEDQRVVASQAGLEAAQKRLRTGVAPALEVTEAETVLTRARTESLIARYGLARARVRLAYVTGLAYPETLLSFKGSNVAEDLFN